MSRIQAPKTSVCFTFEEPFPTPDPKLINLPGLHPHIGRIPNLKGGTALLLHLRIFVVAILIYI